MAYRDERVIRHRRRVKARKANCDKNEGQEETGSKETHLRREKRVRSLQTCAAKDGEILYSR